MITELEEEVYQAALGQTSHSRFVVFLVLNNVDEGIQCAAVDETLPRDVPAFLLHLFQFAKGEDSRQQLQCHLHQFILDMLLIEQFTDDVDGIDTLIEAHYSFWICIHADIDKHIADI